MSASDMVPTASGSAGHPSHAIPAVSLSIDLRKEAWQLKHGNVSAGTPAYWAMRAVERDAIFLNEADNVTIVSEDDVSVAPEEFTYPLAAWQAIYDLHGWTHRVQREWKSANIGLNGHVYQHQPWRILTQETRNAWFRDGVFPVTY